MSDDRILRQATRGTRRHRALGGHGRLWIKQFEHHLDGGRGRGPDTLDGCVGRA
ncbi:MAG TPA: hypothetical protein VIK04_17720 [Solirubrobacteraceae bacterium]